MIRAFAKEQKVPTINDTQMQRWQDATAAAKEAHVRSSVHWLHNSCNVDAATYYLECSVSY